MSAGVVSAGVVSTGVFAQPSRPRQSKRTKAIRVRL
ncbi:MAG: hypothetical protein J6D21_07240 [Clostridia bacterium]|nr:hypothetical protein [Clostridia bacterium]